MTTAVLFGVLTVVFIAAAWTDPWTLVAIATVAICASCSVTTGTSP